MTRTRLLWRNLLFHWRGNLAVCLGVAVGTAVLTGALLVGDSLRGSLRALTEQRLGWVDQAMVTGRFFRGELAAYLAADKAADGIAPAIMLQGTVSTSSDHQLTRRAGRVTILGVDDRFWLDGQDPLSYFTGHRYGNDPRPGGDSEFWQSARNEVLLSQELANELGVRPGDPVTLHLQKASAVPRETILGRRDGSDLLAPVRATVKVVLASEHFGSRFSVAPSPMAPRNAFVPLRLLQEELGQKDLVNALFVRGASPNLLESFRRHMTLADWGLTLWQPQSRTDFLFAKLGGPAPGARPFAGDQLSRGEWRNRISGLLADRADAKTGVLTDEAVRKYYEDHGYLSLENRQLLLEPAVAEAAQRAAKRAELRTAPTLVYLANSIANNRLEYSTIVAALDPLPWAGLRLAAADAYRMPYSVVAALDPSDAAPLGPFIGKEAAPLADNEIILADWKESPLQVQSGDRVSLTYFEPVQEGRLKEQTRSFKLKAVIPLERAAADPDLTPEFPGITDKLTLKDWNPPFPYDGRRVKKTDEDYWNRYRTTPKAYITLKKGQELWSSRFGDLTSIRLAPEMGAQNHLAAAAVSFQKHLLEELKPESGGFVFEDVRRRGLDASAGGVDFSMLFLGFSFFLIVSALLLVGLLVRLNLDRRAPEIGLLLAAGYPVRSVRRLLLAEGGILAAVGGLVGLAAAVLYAWGLLGFLNAYWPADLDRSFLRLHVSAQSFAVGYMASLLVSLLTIAWAVRVLRRAAPAALLGGQTLQAGTAAGDRGKCWSIPFAVASLVVGILLIVAGGFIHDHEAQAGTFFGGGALLLTAGLAAASAYLRRPEPATHGLLAASPGARVGSLGVRNAGRYPTRSLLTAGLLASSAFLIVAVESFRRQPGQDFLAASGGSGGFALIGESAVPVYQDLNQGPGRQELIEALERSFRQQAGGKGTLAEQLHRAEAALDQTTIMALRLRAGDDASCLNLYQPGRPRLLGVPSSLVERGGFHLSATLAQTDEEKRNPWLLLQKSGDDAVPVFGEENSVGWMLKKKLGDVVELPNEQGRPVNLRIVGLFKDSIFQSELIMAESRFLSLFPGQEGYNFFLIQTPPGQQAEVKTLLEAALADRGFDVTPSAQRLAQYLAVENTYLSTFQALGGLGLLLGTLGLAVVLLRSVWERRGELALLRALGFRQRALGWLVLAENAFLLGLGLLVGAVAAFVSVAPHVLEGQGKIPWLRLLAVLGVVLVVGLAAGSLAMRSTLRAPLVPALRRE
jgi:ABC-type antimicrobial peptide transport system permease subunit